MSEPFEVFYSYSHADEGLRDTLEKHLSNLRRQGVITDWHDRKITAGDEWANQIDEHIESAAVILLLVSADFLASDYCYDVEMKRALERHDANEACVIPVILRSVDWKGAPFGKLQALPKDAKPVTLWDDLDEAFTDVARGIRKVAERLRGVAARPAPPGKPKIRPEDVSLAKLPSTRPELFGRDDQLALLDESWTDGKTNVVTFVAFGGVGKTALVNVWLERMRRDNFRGARRVYGWSFYSQGASQDKQASGDEFIAAALKEFGDPDPTQGSPWDKGERLAKLVRRERTLLVLDGLEPLQYPPGQQAGRLRDPAVQSLLRELAVDNNGLCVVSTRIEVDDLKDYVGGSVRKVDLEDLTPEAGAQLLAKLGVKGTDDELRQAAEEFAGLALALTLLGHYLEVVHDGDVRQRDKVPKLTADPKDGGHARRVMECYERWFAGKPELSILRMLGLFDRPAVGGAIDALRADPPIADLTADLQGLSDAEWKFALKALRDVRLLAEADPNDPETLDCHPLIREHFADKLRNDHPDAWREGHNRLFEYFRGPGCTKELPDTLDEMAPLFAAVTHGCHAGRYEEALDDVYISRIQRHDQFFSFRSLGAFGANLAALAGFYNPPWTHPAEALTRAGHSSVSAMAGFVLRALGRLREAAHPMQAALELSLAATDWVNAAARASNLSELYLMLGDTAQAIKYARRSVEFADQSGSSFERLGKHTTLADALNHAGRPDDAESLFREAEQLQQEYQPEYPVLYSFQGFRYCELLLDLGKCQDVLERATRTLLLAREQFSLLTVALDHLSLGRAHLMAAQHEGTPDFTEAEEHLNQAVDGLRSAGTQHELPRGLVARAEYYRVRGQHEPEADEFFKLAKRDLDEALAIATRGQMRLREADAHLEYARLHLAQGQKAEARHHLDTAAKIVKETGYHRRDPAITELEQQLK